MQRDTRKLSLIFLLSLIPTLLAGTLLPSWRLTFFAPLLIITYYRKPVTTALWMALLCGGIIDLLSDTRLGLHALTYCLTTKLIYRYKRHFFEDSTSTIPLMTLFFSVIATLIQAVLVSGSNTSIAMSWRWAATDLVLMPIADALYALVFFTLPSWLGSRPSIADDDIVPNRPR